MSMAKNAASGGTKNGMVVVADQRQGHKNCSSYAFQMPLHYPRYKKADYETMPEWRVDCLLREYGLPVSGDLESKRKFAMGAFLWPDQY
ncbi:hypothetical protein PR202_gb22982 [Eleusine coracana subsp. coracana]|uniref:DUF7722 domain-containing protein n=1 Tax=Eleusine coracana subsp. coracana TaxID=191504 RepID=A0AAV5FI93_ELECO|nr:hypothetical protein QOZ80_6BG0484100 [Eleusine coracana subsp. coracana]GJN34332.1 hypothetical protein PR202_gb22982 [Eleusine coracana subsp. coracana]